VNTGRAVLLTVLFLPSLLLAEGLSEIEQRIGAFVDAHGDDFVRDLEAAVQIDSVTENLAGVKRLGEAFGRDLAGLGFESAFVELPASTARAGHLVAERKGDRGRRVLLIGHLDTVLPGGNFRREGDRALGSGTNDMKGGDLVLIHALRALHAVGALEGTRILVVMTGDEESVGEPQALCRKVLFEAAARSDVALSFETSIGQTATVARRGSIAWEIEVEGVGGHSSGIFSEPMGAGAVYESSRIVSEFYRRMRQFDGLTLNPAVIAGGTEVVIAGGGVTVSGKKNITARRTLIRGDLRTLDATQLAAAKREMELIVAENLPRTSAKIVFKEGYPAMPETPANHALLAELDQVSRDLGYGPMTAYDPRGRGAGDVAFVSPPLPALDGLGIRGEKAHAPGEWADLATVPELVKRTAVLVYRLTR
jgi:glutamate carboxypeptidase